MIETEWFEERSGEQHERCFRWRVGFILYAALAAVLILFPLLTGCSSVERKSVYDGPPMVASGGDGSVRLTKEPCPNVSGWLAMGTAEMIYKGVKYLACWFPLGQHIIILDSNGDASGVPAQAFHQEQGV